MLDRAYVGSGRSWLRRDKNSGSTAIDSIGDGSLSLSRSGLGFASACKWAHRSPNMATTRSSRIPVWRPASRSARRPCSEPDRNPVLSVVAGVNKVGSTKARSRLLASKLLYAAAAASTRRRRSRTRSSLRSRTRRMVDRDLADLSAAAGLDWMSDSTGGWYNLIGKRCTSAAVRRERVARKKRSVEALRPHSVRSHPRKTDATCFAVARRGWYAMTKWSVG